MPLTLGLWNTGAVFDSFIFTVIIACEVGFWLLVAAGLALRYLWRQPRWSAIALSMVIVLDLLLVVAVGFDLHRGSEVDTVHIVAGIYLGGSVAFGRRMISWADVRFAYHFAGGPKPATPPNMGRAGFRYEWRLFLLWLVAAGVTLLTNAVLAFTVASPQQREELFGVISALAIITAVWLVSGPVWVLGKNIFDPVPRDVSAGPDTPTTKKGQPEKSD